MAAAQPNGTVTLFFSDIEGSTRLLHELGPEAYRQALAEHRRVMREAFERHGGYEVDYEGDAFFVAFASAAEAVAAAAEAQAALATGPIRVRMGLHTGEPILDPPKYVGMDVHLAARIMSAGHGGQVLLSRATRELVETEVTGLGEHRLKDIERPVALYQLGSVRFPPLKTISNTNLPRPPSSFVGRQVEVAEVVNRVRAARLVTLTGPGGTGKTRLAIEAAAELVGEFKAGVFWIGLATIHDPALVMETIAQTLGAKGALAEHVGEREPLVLLDNFEQVVDAAPELSSLLRACPNLRLLVTSRELLRIDGESEYPVLPLAEREAVELFCARSRFEPDEAIAELCRRLDDLPLAVELAAARTSVLTPAQILERVGQRLDLLKGGRDADPRQATLRTTIEWSYELLTPEEQTIFARLAVFAGGCTLDAAEKIADADLDVLQSLVEKSLLRHSDERFWMLETVRSFASERCDASSGSEALEARFVEWFVGLAEAGEAGIRAEERGWLGRLAQEQANLRAALEYSMRARDPDAFVRLAGALGVFWFFRAQLEEARRWLTVALARSEAPAARGKILPALVMAHLWQGDLDTAAQLVDQLLAIRDDLDPRTRADALHIAGIYHGFRGSFSAATELYEASAAISRETENTWLLRQTLNNLGDAALNQDDLELAERYFEEAVAVANDRGGDGPRAGAIAAFGGLATVAAARGDNALARQRFRSMLALVRDSDYREVGVIGPMLIHIAAFALDDGEVEASRRLLAAVDVFFAEVGMAMLTALDRRVYDRTSEGIRLNSTDAREPPAAADRATDLEAALELAEAVCA